MSAGMYLLAGALGAAAAIATPATAASDACTPTDPVIYRDAAVDVWAHATPDAHVLYVGCDPRSGRTFTILDFDNDCVSASGGCDDVAPRVGRRLRAGSWRALCVSNGITGALALTDVGARRTPRPAGYLSIDPPRELRLRADGALAWISPYVDQRFHSTRRLLLCDRRCRSTGGPARTLAKGRYLARLRLGPTRVSWSDGARRHVARVR